MFNLNLVVVCLALLSSGRSAKHRFTVLFNENGNNNNSDELLKYGPKQDSLTFRSKEIALKGKVRTSMVFITSLTKENLQTVAKTNHKTDMVCSPVASYLALAKLGFGASPSAKLEIERALGEEYDTDVKNKAKKIHNTLRTLPGVTLHFGSRIFLSMGVKLSTPYVKKVEAAFQSSIFMLDFSDKTKATNIINSWVSGLTHQIIKTIVKPSDLPQPKSRSLIIVNAIYFKGNWKYPFNKMSTKVGDFFIDGDKTKRVSYMRMNRQFQYIDHTELDAQLILLPFKGDESSMLIALPKLRNGLYSLITKLMHKPVQLGQAILKMEMKHVRLSLPKFTVASNLDLGAVFKLLGVHEIFRDGGLTGISTDKDLVVSKAIQKTYIAVDEIGAEGAQASAIVVEKISASLVDPEEMAVDHPFLFMILAGGEQIFSGVYAGQNKLI